MTVGTEPARSPVRKVRLTSGTGRLDANLQELYEFRELLVVFTWRLVAVQYKQSVLGLGWAIINPLITTIVFSVVFGVVAGISSGAQPYPIFVLSGLILWQYFTRAVSAGSASLVGNAGIITKVYFPRLILPLSAVLAAVLDLAVATILLLAMMLYYGMAPSLTIIVFPAFVFMTLALAMGVSLFLSGVNALYRDVGFVVPFMLQIWMYLTPIIYPIHLVPESWRWILYLNPMSAFVEGARWSILGGPPPSVLATAVGCIVTMTILAAGVALFRRLEALFVDRI
jgi:lipopolysaccharide transport system permease protein